MPIVYTHVYIQATKYCSLISQPNGVLRPKAGGRAAEIGGKAGEITESLRSPIVTPSKLLRSPIVTTRSQHARNAPASGLLPVNATPRSRSEQAEATGMPGG